MHICMADDTRSAALKAAARRHGARVVDRRVDSQLLVVDDVAAAGQKALWAAVLVGATIASTQRLTTAGLTGTFVAYKSAVRIRRWIWMSAEFMAHHPAISQIVVDAAATHRSLWRLLATRVDFVDKSSSSASLQYVMGIVTAREKKQAGSPTHKCVEHMQVCRVFVLAVSLCIA